LNIWYRDHVADMGIKNFVYCEEHKTGRLSLGFGGILVVDKTSADPGIPDVTPISLDEDHISICKPAREGERSRVYRQVKQMTEELIHVSASFSPQKSEPHSSSAPQLEGRHVNKIKFTGGVRIEICRRLGNSWKDLATILEIPTHEQRTFKQGKEPDAIWEWLEDQRRLATLESALTAVGRDDLAEVLRRNPQ